MRELGIKVTGNALRRGMLAAILAGLSVLLLAVAISPAESRANHNGKDRSTRHVMFVGNNWDGTVDVHHPRGKFRKITRINVIPDINERMAEIATDPVRLGYFLAIREAVGEGHDQYADDMYTSNDGELLVISRPSFRDVVAINLNTRKIVWRFVVDGQRSDHMAVSPDGTQVAVSASTGNVVHILDIKTGEEDLDFESGDSPHENVYSKDGSVIYHASIGLVYTPVDQPFGDTSKGDRYFQIVDSKTGEILSRVNMGEKLAEAGFPNMSAAVRPMTITKDEKFAYLQVSFFHGFIEYNIPREKVRRVVSLPVSDEVRDMPREQYLLDSAHHGIALNHNDNRLCVAGTMSDYVAIVSRKTTRYKIFRDGKKPYWSTESNNGTRCFVSWSGSDKVSVYNYKTRKRVAEFKVGFHPQRIREGNVTPAWIQAQK